jgi:hypothetical protein
MMGEKPLSVSPEGEGEVTLLDVLSISFMNSVSFCPLKIVLFSIHSLPLREGWGGSRGREGAYFAV